MTEAKRHLTWEALSAMIAEGRPFRLGIDGTPQLELVCEDRGRRFGLLVPYPADSQAPVSGFLNVYITKRSIDETSYLSISTASQRLFQEFHAFLTGVADSIQLDHVPVVDAIRERLSTWNLLFARAQLLSAEEEIGLIGELWVLQRLITSAGAKALRSWTGPAGEPHDFRVGTVEYEVKTTRKTKRLHTVNGLAQLVPTPGHSLVIVSLQVQAAGTSEGFGLPAMVASTEQMLAGEPVPASEFRTILLERFGYSPKVSHLYMRTYSFRSLPRIVPVDEHCPRLIRSWITSAAGTSVSARVVDVDYEIDVDGMGFEEGAEDYSRFNLRA